MCGIVKMYVSSAFNLFSRIKYALILNAQHGNTMKNAVKTAIWWENANILCIFTSNISFKIVKLFSPLHNILRMAFLVCMCAKPNEYIRKIEESLIKEQHTHIVCGGKKCYIKFIIIFFIRSASKRRENEE